MDSASKHLDWSRKYISREKTVRIPANRNRHSLPRPNGQLLVHSGTEGVFAQVTDGRGIVDDCGGDGFARQRHQVPERFAVEPGEGKGNAARYNLLRCPMFPLTNRFLSESNIYNFAILDHVAGSLGLTRKSKCRFSCPPQGFIDTGQIRVRRQRFFGYHLFSPQSSKIGLLPELS